MNWVDRWIHLLILVSAGVLGVLRDGSFHYLTLVFDFQGEIEAGTFQAISSSLSLQRWQYKNHGAFLQVSKWCTEKLMTALVLPATAPSAFLFPVYEFNLYTFFQSLCRYLWGKERPKLDVLLFSQTEIKILTAEILCSKISDVNTLTKETYKSRLLWIKGEEEAETYPSALLSSATAASGDLIEHLTPSPKHLLPSRSDRLANAWFVL